MFSKTAVSFALICMMSSSVQAEDLLQRKTSELTRIEATLIAEIHQRTCQTILPSDISYMAFTKGKRDADKKKLAANIYKLIAMKMALLERMKVRETTKTHDAFASVDLSDINVADDDDLTYENPYIAPVTISLGGVSRLMLTNSGSTGSEVPSLPFNITYCEKGDLFINGHQVDPMSKRVNFKIFFDHSTFNVSAHMTATKSGWE
ncbi:hypothetical protein [Marinomonas flavescens]|uniref:hypothetical protein n=1 Tax=Marinomonas flavescens TaxID=2529379 RepID=UPI001055EA74|nr:hypothetical protein [Marinomonas flavescens]